ncbi:phosphatidylinositol 3 and 4-kinase, partial [Fragilariopsis cylindrus CCMP1102]
GGTYFLHNSRKAKIAVFKASDEEPYAENNPRGYIQQPGQDMFLREGVIPGEACIREVAAFMLDHGGFSGVPMTTLVECRHPTFNINGSRMSLAEEFVRTDCCADDISPSKLSVEEVHKIAVLDIRLMNADRNSANLLCRRKTDNSIELVPIDHGFCLRSVADNSWMDWCWLDWPHLKQPMSRKTKKYILHLDIAKDAKMLQERFNICGEALDYFYASSSILKAGTKAGLSLYEIAVMCCRNDNLGEVPSKLE